MSEAFDPEALRLSPEIAAQIGKKPAGQQRQKQPRRTEPFLQIQHRAIIAASHILPGTKQFLVWLYIHHRVWADKTKTVLVGNKTLDQWGVGRKEKIKALHRLESGGLISVQWRERLSPLVTLLG
jgi:hypothetical protein